MFIQKLGGSWIKHPFLRSSFLLEDDNDIKRILRAGIKDVWIDEIKGLPRVQQEKPEKVSDELAEPEPNATPVSKDDSDISMGAEVDRARKSCNSAKKQVKLMYEDVRLGKAIDPTTILPMIGEIDSMVQRNSSAILSVARLKTHDDYTYMHSVAVCALMLTS